MAIALVQSAFTQDLTGTTGSATFTTTPTVGNTIVVSLAGSGAACSFAAATVSDNAGNTYTRQAAASFNGSDAVALFTAPITATIAAFTVTFAGASGVTDTDICISCWSGVDAAVLDGAAVTTTNAGAAPPFAMNAVTTAAAGAVLVMVGAASDSGGSVAVGTGPTGAANTSLDQNAFVLAVYCETEYGPALNTGAQVMKSNVNGNAVSFSGAVLALKAAAGAPTQSFAGIGRSVTRASAALVQTLALAGTGRTAAGGSAALAQTMALQPVARAVTSASSTLQFAAPTGVSFAGIGRSVTRASAALAQTLALAGTARTTTAGSAALAQTMALTPVARSVTRASSALGQTLALAGTARTTVAGSAALAQTMALTPVARSVTRASAALAQTLALAGTARTTAAGSAALAQTMAFTPVARAVTQATAALQFGVAGSVALAGIGRSVTRASAALVQSLALAGTARTAAAGSGTLAQGLTLQPVARAAARASASMTVGVALAAVARATSSGRAALAWQVPSNLPFDALYRVALRWRNFAGAAPARAWVARLTGIGAVAHIAARTWVARAAARTWVATVKAPAMSAVTLPDAKDPRESKTITLDATAALPSGVTLTSVLSVTVTDLAQLDLANARAAFGAPVINTTSITLPAPAAPIGVGMAVQIPATGGVDGARYLVAITCATSQAGVTETLKVILNVSQG